MAKRRKSTGGTTTRIVRVAAPRAAAPIVKVTAPRAAPVKHRRRSRSRVGGGGTLNSKNLVGVVVGGALLGWVERYYGAKLPSIPILGVKGTIAIGAYFANRQGIARDITRDVCIAAAATAGYQVGKEGKVSGDDVEGYDVDGEIAPQVGAVAAQI